MQGTSVLLKALNVLSSFVLFNVATKGLANKSVLKAVVCVVCSLARDSEYFGNVNKLVY